ncbi:serine hydroxymethyltransferase [Spiroplasma endosymbiont of Amphibalanus improvisus]|uniref:serine hydroxymethyltransferase n=1 Tax=Spiroplasma endosymbiont of Amphibalanus improvisus TaxID=3066327 RepID=UPI00313D1E2F
MIDKQIKKYLNLELNRQKQNVELIASENFVSEEILTITGSVLTNKYSEGYPFKRYYGGCQYIDEIEQYGIDQVKKIYNAEHANIQPHSGSQANFAAYYALLEPQDKILGMSLEAGGHLTHGYKINFSGKLYNSRTYGVNAETGLLDYEEIEKIALEFKPKLIIAGASAYSRTIDFAKFKMIADKVGAYLMVDMAHIAGLIAAGLHPAPFPYADVVTSTTHKTLRGPRGGIILCKKALAKKIDSSVFPGNQGGPLEHVIAGKAQCFSEALKPEFIEYQKQVISNAQALSERLKEHGFKLITNGTDNHLILVNVKDSINITGAQAQEILEKINITCNKNMIPNDTESPFITSGIRLGTPAMTTVGFKEKEFKIIADVMNLILKNNTSDNIIKCQKIILDLMNKFKIYNNIKY